MSTNLEIAVPSSPTAERSHHWMVATSCVLWLLVAAATVYGGFDDGDQWEAAYAVFNVVLTLAAAVVGMTAARWSRPATRALLWSIGVVVLVVAVLSTLVGAWASPLWQAALAVAFVLFAVGTDRPRSPLLALAAAQLAGIAAFFVGDALGVGDVDSYGDHPLAGDVSVVLSSLLTAAAVWLTVRSPDESTP